MKLEFRIATREWVEKWEDLKRPATGFYICGFPDLAEPIFAALFKEVLKRCHTAFCISALELVDFVTRNPEFTQAEALDKLCEPGLLAIYNVGREFHDRAGFNVSVFSRVINRRRDNLRPVMYSSSFTPEMGLQHDCHYPTSLLEGIWNTAKFFEVG